MRARREVTLDDNAMIQDILTSHKGLVTRYGTALIESSCEKMRSLVNKKLSECARDQFDAFNYMHDRDLYPTDPAPTPKVQQAKRKFAAVSG